MLKFFQYLGREWKIASLSAIAVFLYGFFQVTRANVVTGTSLPWLCNDGIAFGIDVPPVLFTILWVVVMLGVLILWKSAGKQVFSLHLPFVLIVVGALSNITDRLIHGCVVDYISLIPWNTFNLADSVIFIGAVLLLIRSFKK